MLKLHCWPQEQNIFPREAVVALSLITTLKKYRQPSAARLSFLPYRCDCLPHTKSVIINNIFFLVKNISVWPKGMFFHPIGFPGWPMFSGPCKQEPDSELDLAEGRMQLLTVIEGGCNSKIGKNISLPRQNWSSLTVLKLGHYDRAWSGGFKKFEKIRIATSVGVCQPEVSESLIPGSGLYKSPNLALSLQQALLALRQLFSQPRRL